MTHKYLFKYHFIALIVILLLQLSWTLLVYPSFPNTITLSICIVSIVFIFTAALIPTPKPALLQSQVGKILPIILTNYGVAFFLIMLLRLEYSRPILLSGLAVTSCWFVIFYYQQENRITEKLYFLGHAYDKSLDEYNNITFVEASVEQPLRELTSGIVVDLRHRLTVVEERLLADCAIAKIPIYHFDILKEKIRRKVSNDSLSENTLSSFQPDTIYQHLKDILDKLFIVVTSPFSIPICIVIAILIKFENKHEKIIFTQQRVGLRNKTFTIYKFRTMNSSLLSEKETFAYQESNRISKYGKFLRKTRLDELPQFWNVFKGEMSIIGPRPEQPKFVESYSEEVPFYNYRHIVKPGISGWAQVNQGYTYNTPGTKEKLSYDLYYIKNFGWTLDFEISLKTIHVICTGKGAI